MDKVELGFATVQEVAEYVYTHGNNQSVIDRLYNEHYITFTQYSAVTSMMPAYERYKNALSNNTVKEATK